MEDVKVSVSICGQREQSTQKYYLISYNLVRKNQVKLINANTFTHFSDILSNVPCCITQVIHLFNACIPWEILNRML